MGTSSGLESGGTEPPPGEPIGSNLTMSPRPALIGVKPSHSRAERSLRALVITLTDDSAMAAAAIWGDSRSLKLG
jgi:hypothetical protein